MLLKKTIKGMYRYKGDTDGFYRTGETFYLTVVYKRLPRRIEVTCRHGFRDEPYPDSPTIVYTSEELFRDDWAECDSAYRSYGCMIRADDEKKSPNLLEIVEKLSKSEYESGQQNPLPWIKGSNVITETMAFIQANYILRSDVIEAIDNAYRYEITDMELFEHQNEIEPEVIRVDALKQGLGLQRQRKEEE